MLAEHKVNCFGDLSWHPVDFDKHFHIIGKNFGINADGGTLVPKFL